MRRERALKIVLVVVGLLFAAGLYPLILMAKSQCLRGKTALTQIRLDGNESCRLSDAKRSDMKCANSTGHLMC